MKAISKTIKTIKSIKVLKMDNIIKENKEFKKTFLVIELIVVMIIFSIILIGNFYIINSNRVYRFEVEAIILHMEELITSSKFLAQNFDSSVSLIFDGSGNILIKENNVMKKFSFGKYKVFSSNYDYDEFLFSKDFKMKNRRFGNNGFTIYILKDDTIYGKIVFFVGTSNFRHEVF